MGVSGTGTFLSDEPFSPLPHDTAQNAIAQMIAPETIRRMHDSFHLNEPNEYNHFARRLSMEKKQWRSYLYYRFFSPAVKSQLNHYIV